MLTDYLDLAVSPYTRSVVARMIDDAHHDTGAEVIARRVMEVVHASPFPCLALRAWMLAEPRGFAVWHVHEPDPADGETEEDRRPDDWDLAYIYVITKIWGNTNAVRLKGWMEEGYRYFSIMPDPACGCCDRLAGQAGMRQAVHLEHLPHHWGCRCSYRPLTIFEAWHARKRTRLT